MQNTVGMIQTSIYSLFRKESLSPTSDYDNEASMTLNRHSTADIEVPVNARYMT